MLHMYNITKSAYPSMTKNGIELDLCSLEYYFSTMSVYIGCICVVIYNLIHDVGNMIWKYLHVVYA